MPKADVDIGINGGVYMIDKVHNADIATVDTKNRFAPAIGGALFIRVGGAFGPGKLFVLGRFTYVNSTPLTKGGDLGPAGTGLSVELGYKFDFHFID